MANAAVNIATSTATNGKELDRDAPPGWSINSGANAVNCAPAPGRARAAHRAGRRLGRPRAARAAACDPAAARRAGAPAHQGVCDWGFAAQGERGLGISGACSPARAGSARRWRAKCSHASCGLDLYRIDLSAVVSKYIGETEKNLRARVRRRGRQRRDPAVRRGRCAVRQAQRGEGQPRPLRQHRGQLSAAAHGGVSRPRRCSPPTSAPRSTRRSCAGCVSSCSFRFPTWRSAKRSGARVFPACHAAWSDWTTRKLARLQMAGGHIRNIALNAAFLAAEADEPLRMAHLRAPRITKRPSMNARCPTRRRAGGYETRRCAYRPSGTQGLSPRGPTRDRCGIAGGADAAVCRAEHREPSSKHRRCFAPHDQECPCHPGCESQRRGDANGPGHCPGNNTMTQAAPLQTSNAKPKQSEGSGVLLQRKCACGSNASGLTGKCEECGEKRMLRLQTKLAISEPGDRYEQEADRIADEVMRMPLPAAYRQATGGQEADNQLQTKRLADQITPMVQREAIAEEDDEDEKEELQRQTAMEEEEMLQPKGTTAQAPTVTRSVESIIQSMRQDGGQPLDPAARAFMEPRFGHDFSNVRVHTDSQAANAARAVNARAFTVGSAVVFGTGQYAPRAAEGRRLLAHELSHVVQQTNWISDSKRIESGRPVRGVPSIGLSVIRRKSRARPAKDGETQTSTRRPTGFLGRWLRKRVPKGLKPTKLRAALAQRLLDLAGSGEINLTPEERKQLEKLTSVQFSGEIIITGGSTAAESEGKPPSKKSPGEEQTAEIGEEEEDGAQPGAQRQPVEQLALSQQGQDFLAQEEGEILQLYDDGCPPRDRRCGRGHCTIGVGHLVHRNACNDSHPAEQDFLEGIDRERSRELLRQDLANTLNTIRRHVTVELTQNEFDALVSYVFNTGALAGTQMLENLNRGDYEGAAREMDIVTSAGRVLRGLERRRQRERDLFLSATY